MTKSRGILPPRQFWTDEQIQMLKGLYPDHRAADIAPQIGRSERSIYSMAKILGIKKSEAFLMSGMAGRLDGVRGGATRFKKGHQTLFQRRRINLVSPGSSSPRTSLVTSANR